MSADDPRETATIQIRFLRHLLDRLDALAEQASPWDGIRRLREVIAVRLSVITDTEPAEPAADGAGYGRCALIRVELHRLRDTRTATTITTRDGHSHRGRVLAVGHHHTAVHTDLGLAPVLVPLRFIESVDPLESSARP
ncbi:hypothetical protein [Nocardia noduli]|uniref:hypothetical protein n=1 Tax=Nocardia noduli TaxID=2815722 RepID=UPI001C24A370|nr:hypothetical protein [Nocardia noduli]